MTGFINLWQIEISDHSNKPKFMVAFGLFWFSREVLRKPTVSNEGCFDKRYLWLGILASYWLGLSHYPTVWTPSFLTSVCSSASLTFLTTYIRGSRTAPWLFNIVMEDFLPHYISLILPWQTSYFRLTENHLTLRIVDPRSYGRSNIYLVLFFGDLRLACPERRSQYLNGNSESARNRLPIYFR